MDKVVLKEIWLDSVGVCCSGRQPECHTSQQQFKFSLKVKAYRYPTSLDTRNA